LSKLSFAAVSETDKKEMSFVDHLEELRGRLIKGIIPVLIFTIVAFVMMDKIFKYIIIAPAQTDFWTYRILCKISEVTCVDKIDFVLQSRTLTGQFTMHLTASFVVGFIVAFPFLFWQLWRFIEPALNPNERKNAYGSIFFVSILFFIGVVFGYYIVSPLSINFLANYRIDESILNQFDITSYISMLCLMVLGCGLIFQLPVVVYVLSRLGIVTPGFMRKYRRHSIVVILIVAAILTPSPDVLSQMLVGLPMILLYEMSIFISAAIDRQRRVELTKNQ
jgi:sec-independent protein translocase protein TatC